MENVIQGPVSPEASYEKTRRWTGRVMSGVASLFLAFDGIGKLLSLPPVVEGTTQLGYPASLVVPIGVLQLACLIVYVFPRSSIVGAVLLTGYLGGAVATHVRVESPLFTHVLFPIYVAVLLWGGLFLLDGRLRVLTRRPAT